MITTEDDDLQVHPPSLSDHAFIKSILPSFCLQPIFTVWMTHGLTSNISSPPFEILSSHSSPSNLMAVSIIRPLHLFYNPSPGQDATSPQDQISSSNSSDLVWQRLSQIALPGSMYWKMFSPDKGPRRPPYMDFAALCSSSPIPPKEGCVLGKSCLLERQKPKASQVFSVNHLVH